MTNSLQLSVLKRTGAAVCAALLIGCSEGDGSAELAEGLEAYARHDLKTADRCLEASLAANGTNVSARVQTALVKVDLGQIAEARKVLKDALDREPEAADVLLLDAEIAYHARDFAAAVLDYRKITENPSNSAEVRSQAFAGMGVVQYTLNEYDQARLSFLRAIRLNYRNGAAHYHLGLLYWNGFGFLEAAREEFNIFTRLVSGADARVQKVQRSYIADIDTTIQRRDMSRPGASNRDSQKGAQLLTEAGKALKAKKYKDARRLYEEAYRADPLSCLAAEGLADVLPKVDRTIEGTKRQLELLRTAAALEPGNTARWLRAADLAYRLNFPAASVELYSRAVATQPEKLEALDGLIRSLNKVGGKRTIAQAYQAYRQELAQRRK